MTQPLEDDAFVRRTAIIVLALVALRLCLAPFVPLMCDEAYYWIWSKNPAFGYYDHPPMVALFVLPGTLIAGDTPFGVRLISILSALPMTWAVYRSAAMLFGDRRLGAKAAILFNATMMVAVGTVIVTPDVPLMLATSFILFFLAKVLTSGRGAWWLAVGAASGLALVSKYNALLSGLIIVIWLACIRGLRRWLASPWTYAGGLVALAIFTPVIAWNADHQWASFAKQFGRARIDRFAPHFLVELLGSHFLFLTPAVCFLSLSGLYALGRNWRSHAAPSVLILASVWVIFAYFAFHALHDSVHPDWLCQLYPAAAVAAAFAVTRASWSPRWRRTVDVADRSALPTSLVLTALLVVQVHTGFLTGSFRDESARVMGVGAAKLARDVQAERERTGAACVVTTDYITTAWLTFYSPPGSCVEQFNQRLRWIARPAPDPQILAGKLLFVATDQPVSAFGLERKFSFVQPLGSVDRMRRGLKIQTYDLALVSCAHGDLLEPMTGHVR